MFEIALMAQIILWLAVLGVFLASGQASLFHPSTFYLGFHALVFVIRPILVHYLAFDSVWVYIGFMPTESDMIKTLAVTSVGLIVFVGANLAVGWTQVSFPAEPAETFSALQRKSLFLTVVLLSPMIVYSLYVTNSGQGGGERAANGVFIMTTSTGYINDAQFMIAPLLGAWLLIVRFHWLSVFPVIMYIGYRSWCGVSRFTIITFLITLVMAYCWYHRKKWIPFSAVVLAIPTLILFNTLGNNRDYLQTLLKGQGTAVMQLNAGMSQFEKFRAHADTQDFANFDYLTFLVALVPERTETYTYGAQYLQLFTEPIPRILWKGKPTGAPVRTFDIGHYGNFVGLTFSLPGDGWCSGGWIGLIITMGLVGTILGFFHRWFWRQVNRPISAVIYCTSMGMLIQWYRDGGISIAKFIMWSWLPFLVWIGSMWVLNGRRLPGNSILVRPGESLRIIQRNQ